jgi:predicted transcriptional regulator
MTHDISSIFLDLLMKIGMLAQSQILEARPADLLTVLENFLAASMETQELLEIMLKEHRKAIEGLLSSDNFPLYLRPAKDHNCSFHHH